MTIEKIDYTTTPRPSGVVALSLKDAPALIESLLPVQKLSIDVYKERMANMGQTLTALGNYWKGRKPLILNRACVLASLLPATEDPVADLEVFELLMGMDDVSLSKRIGLAKPQEIVRSIYIEDVGEYFVWEGANPDNPLPKQAPFNLSDYSYLLKGVIKTPKLVWRSDIDETTKHALSARLFETESYKDLAIEAKRAEEINEQLSSHIWSKVNKHLGTKANSHPELVEQLGVMRFGHRPIVADTFSGSGQIPFAAAQLGCDVHASDLNPIACMLTWGAFNVVGAAPEARHKMLSDQQALLSRLKEEEDTLGVESDGNGWRGRVYLYCLEVTCPSSGWKVPVLPSFVVSRDANAVVRLLPDHSKKRYNISVESNVSSAELKAAEKGTYVKNNLIHAVDGTEHINSISSIRGDYVEIIDGKKITKNKLRQWECSDVVFRESDIFNERLYAIQWVKDDGSNRPEIAYRSVTQEDLEREQKVTKYVQENLADWQEEGLAPNIKIEPGFNTSQPIWERGWTHWHHLFNPRQLLIAVLANKYTTAEQKLAFAQLLQCNARLSRWDSSGGGRAGVKGVFDNQALNTLSNYGCRGSIYAATIFKGAYKTSPTPIGSHVVESKAAAELSSISDIYITDPPYGDAVKYEEILEFFIAWLRKNRHDEFSNWTWDSRREVAVKGEDHDFKLSMVAAYKRMAECMPDNGIQIIMFTHQSGNIWADMANIVWASGLRVSAAWYIVTETESALREGSYVKGTILLALRKRLGSKRTSQVDLSYEIEEEVSEQVKRLTGLNDKVVANSKRAKDGNLFEDADLQMAGYAAALQVLTKYSIIDGKDMMQESLRPRIKGQTLLVDELIDFAVNTANKALVPLGLDVTIWHNLNPAERFYLKMLDIESHGLSSLDNYQNFAKAFSVRAWHALMGSDKANEARLRTAVEFGRTEMAEGSELFNTSTRAVLYALMELQAEKDVDDVLAGLPHNLPNYYSERQTVAKLAAYIAKKVEGTRPAEASAARVLAAAIDNQRL